MIATWPKSSGANFLPTALGSVFAWYRKNVGITIATGVSVWADQSGNARDLGQATAGAQPILQSDGGILFDGIAQFLLTSAFVLAQPSTVYLRMKPITWTAARRIFEMNVGGTAVSCTQNPTAPGIRFNAGAALDYPLGLAVGTYGTLAVVLNGASSVIQVEYQPAVTGDAGANAPTGLVLASTQAGANFSNIAVKEGVVFSVAHDQATRNQMVGYMNTL